MAVYTSTSDVGGLLPGGYGDLIVKPVQDAALALNPLVSTTITTPAHDFHVPIVDTDASASWVAEGAEITPTDPTVSELVLTPAKVAALTIVSSELAADTSPQAQEIVGDGLARSIAVQVDTAFFGALDAPAPSGLAALDDADVSRVVAGTAPTNLDAFAEGISLVESAGAKVTAWIANPADALTVQTLKSGTALNTPLLGTDATNGTARQILGVPLLVSPKVAAGTIWGTSAARILTVVREDVEVTSDASVFYTSDRVAVRGIMRITFGFPTPEAIAKIALAAS